MKPPPPRHILHVDMDAFYASVEQRDDPELKGRPLVVGGGGNRGVVAAASYEARRYGIRSAMPMREARRRCPELLQVAPRMAHYRSVSADVFAVFAEFTPLVEGLSLDEAFLDVSGSIALFGPASAIAAAIRKRIRTATGLSASVGVAPNKLVAKIASDLDKPDGLTVVTPANLRQTLDPLPVEVLPGVGRRTLSLLHARHIRTLAELRTAPDSALRAVFGRFAGRARERASGQDERPVQPDRAGKSISAEETFDRDLYDLHDLKRELLRLAERTAARLRAAGLKACTLQLKIRRADFATYSRQRRLEPPTSGTAELYENALTLLAAWRGEQPGAGIRLLGVGGSELVTGAQRDLFDLPGNETPTALDQAVDEIRSRFGSVRLGRARTFDDDQIG